MFNKHRDKPKNILTAVFLLGCTVSLQADSEPPWYREKNTYFPDSAFISVLGKGSTLEKAKTMALNELSLFFKASVNVRQELITKIQQVISGKDDHYARNSIMNEVSVISSQEDFLGVRFTSPWHNKETETWNILAYINKREAEEIYASRINTNKMIIESLLAAAEKETKPIYKYGYLIRAAVLASFIEEDIKNAAVMGDISEYRDIFAFAQKTAAEYRQARSLFTFDIEINTSTSYIDTGKLKRTLRQVIEQAGYAFDPEHAVYTVTGTISVREERLSAIPYNVYSGIELIIKDADSSFFSYSRNYPRTASRTSRETAYNTVVRNIEEDLKNNFIAEFNAAMGG
jgi:hypothetical protein